MKCLSLIYVPSIFGNKSFKITDLKYLWLSRQNDENPKNINIKNFYLRVIAKHQWSWTDRFWLVLKIRDNFAKVKTHPKLYITPPPFPRINIHNRTWTNMLLKYSAHTQPHCIIQTRTDLYSRTHRFKDTLLKNVILMMNNLVFHLNDDKLQFYFNFV